MAKRILCIDLSDGRLALLLLRRAGRQHLAAGHALELLAPGTGPAETAQAVVRAAEREGLTHDECVLVLDSAQALHRDYVLPFSGRSQLDAALAYELEEDLPLDMDQVTFDFTRIRQAKRSSRVCAAIYPRERLTRLLAALAAAGMDPVRVEPEVCSLAMAASLSHRRFPDKALLLDLGYTRTVLAFLQQGGVASVRVLEQGGERLLAAAGTEITPDQLRRALAFTDFSLPAEGDPAAAAVKAGLTRLADEAAKYVTLFEETSESWPGPVILAGELAGATGLRELFMQRLGREAFTLAESPAVRAAFAQAENTEINGLVASLGAGLPGGADQRMNFRKGELARPEGRRLGRTAAYASALAAAVLLCWGLLIGMRTHHDRTTLQAYEAAMDRVFAQALPEVHGNYSRAQQASILKTRIGRLDESTKGSPQAAAGFLQDLQAISAAVHPKLDVVLDRLSSTAKRTSLAGTVGNYQMVEDLRNALVTTKRFAKVDIKGATTEKKSGRVSFEMDLTR